MTRVYLIFLLLITLNAQAQVCGKSTDREGTVTKVIRVQFGKDTITMGVPYKAVDKPGMMMSISSTNHKNYFSFELRSVDPKILNDSVYMSKARVILTMNNADTVQIIPITRNHFDSYTFPTPGAKTLFIHDYLNDKQLAVLRKSRLNYIRFYKDADNFIEFPVTHYERNEFQRAMEYLRN